MKRSVLSVLLATLALASITAGASAECPQAAPTQGSACVDPGFGGCTYTQNGAPILCSCRGGHWACEPMPAPRS